MTARHRVRRVAAWAALLVATVLIVHPLVTSRPLSFARRGRLDELAGCIALLVETLRVHQACDSILLAPEPTVSDESGQDVCDYARDRPLRAHDDRLPRTWTSLDGAGGRLREQADGTGWLPITSERQTASAQDHLALETITIVAPWMFDGFIPLVVSRADLERDRSGPIRHIDGDLCPVSPSVSVVLRA